MEIRALCCNCFFWAHFVQVSPLRATARCTYPPLPTGKGEGLRAAGPDQCGRKRCRCWDGIRAWLGVEISSKFRFCFSIFLFYTSKKNHTCPLKRDHFKKERSLPGIFSTDMSVFGGSNVSRHLEPSLPTSKKNPDLEPLIVNSECSGRWEKLSHLLWSMPRASDVFFFWVPIKTPPISSWKKWLDNFPAIWFPNIKIAKKKTQQQQPSSSLNIWEGNKSVAVADGFINLLELFSCRVRWSWLGITSDLVNLFDSDVGLDKPTPQFWYLVAFLEGFHGTPRCFREIHVGESS